MSKTVDLTGRKFGRLTVIKKLENSECKQERWLCQCDCGNQKITNSKNLIQGQCKSCGCLRIESVKKHGLSNTRLNRVWKSMKTRCYNPKSKDYKNYGGRGIVMCNEWRDNFKSFYDWAMTNGYNAKAEYGLCTIDRVNYDGIYEPSNCKWTTLKEQNNNKKSNKLLVYNGETHTMMEWSEILNIKYDTLQKRIYCGWSVEKAFTEKKYKRK